MIFARDIVRAWQVWDPHSGVCIHELSGHENAV